MEVYGLPELVTGCVEIPRITLEYLGGGKVLGRLGPSGCRRSGGWEFTKGIPSTRDRPSPRGIAPPSGLFYPRSRSPSRGRGSGPPALSSPNRRIVRARRRISSVNRVQLGAGNEEDRRKTEFNRERNPRTSPETASRNLPSGGVRHSRSEFGQSWVSSSPLPTKRDRSSHRYHHSRRQDLNFAGRGSGSGYFPRRGLN